MSAYLPHLKGLVYVMIEKAEVGEKEEEMTPMKLPVYLSLFR